MPNQQQRERAAAVAERVGVKPATVQKYFQLDRYPSPAVLELFSQAWPTLDVAGWRQAFLADQRERRP